MYCIRKTRKGTKQCFNMNTKKWEAPVHGLFYQYVTKRRRDRGVIRRFETIALAKKWIEANKVNSFNKQWTNFEIIDEKDVSKTYSYNDDFDNKEYRDYNTSTNVWLNKETNE